MDRNTLIGFGLIAAILFGYQYLTMPSAEERAHMAFVQDSLAQVEISQKAEQARRASEEDSAELHTPNAALAASSTEAKLLIADTTLNDSMRTARLDSVMQATVEGKYGIFAPSAEGSDQQVVIENGKLQVSIDTKGAQPSIIRLKEYSTHHGQPLLLSDPDSGVYEYSFFAENLRLSTKDLYFKVESSTPNSVRLKASTNDPGKSLVITYTLDSSDYFLKTSLQLVGLDKEVDPANLAFHWELAGRSNEKYLPNERQKSTVWYKYQNEDRNYLSESADDSLKFEGRTNWVAFKQDFFSVAMVSDEGFGSNGSRASIHVLADTAHTKAFGATLYFDKQRSAQVEIPMRLYLGPNHYNTLRATKIEQFDRLVDLGWGIFGWMNRFLVIPIFNFLGGFNLSYGIIILVLTIVIKLLLMPLTYRNQKSSARMRALKPEVDAINEKFKDGDAMKKQQAVMELYRKAHVNPAAGCVPMLIQMPILFAMFRFFPASIELRQQSFLWADDLSSFDSVLSWTGNIPFISSTYGNHVSLFCLLMALSTIIYTWINSKQMPTQQGMPGMKTMMYLFPVMMLLFMNNFSSGLSYYYLLANVISILQMTVLSRFFIDEKALRTELLANMKKPVKKSKWQARLDEMQKEQQRRRK